MKLFCSPVSSPGVSCAFVDTVADYLPPPSSVLLLCVVVCYLSFVRLLGGRDLSDTVQQRCQGRLLPVRITSSAAAAAAISNHLIKMENTNTCSFFVRFFLLQFCVTVKSFLYFLSL